MISPDRPCSPLPSADLRQVSLFGDEKNVLLRLVGGVSAAARSPLAPAAAVHEDEGAALHETREQWRGLPPEGQRAIERVVRGKELDLVFQTDQVLESEDAEAKGDEAGIGRASSARAFVQYSPELETLRWSWTGYIGLDQVAASLFANPWSS